MSTIYLTRRAVMRAGAGMTLAALAPGWTTHAATRDRGPFTLVANGDARVPLRSSDASGTAVWSYGGDVPGPELRVKQGAKLRFTVENRLNEVTTVHAHGLRMPNAMDGVPFVTQDPIAPGRTFTYEFDAPDAGTYWYHPHTNSMEQIARGLYGALIVEERDPIDVDRDVTWILDDWRLSPDGEIVDDFGGHMDLGMAGRIGNTVTVNGRQMKTFPVRSGERIRLRLINTANARIFGLDFVGHRPVIIAYDGQPVEPHEPPGGQIVVGPAMRVDLIIDMTEAPGKTFQVLDGFYAAYRYTLTDVVYVDDAPLRRRSPSSPVRLSPNTMPEPNIDAAESHIVTFGGGMMGGMMGGGMGDGGAMNGGMMNGGPMGRMMNFMMGRGKMWSINGIAYEGPVMDPLLTLRRGKSYVLALKNETAFPHPIHLHGHSFRVIRRNGRDTRFREWQDTVLIPPRETADIAFVADNPGDWMFHCHIAEHIEAGMMAIVRVA